MPIDFIPSNFDVAQYIKTGTGECTIYPNPQPGDEGKMRFESGFSHLNYDCPIAKFGQVGSMPLMMWFGNTLGNAHSTYESLRLTGDSTNAGRLINRSAYYFPAIIDKAKNKALRPTHATFYYTINRAYLQPITSPDPAFGTSKPAQMIPVGLQMIYGPRSGEAPWAIYQTENGEAGTCTTFAELADKGGTGRVIIRIVSPMFWDGVNLDSPDHRSHVAYGVNDNQGNWNHAPLTHPYPFTQITTLIMFENDGPDDYRNWATSMDIARGLPGGSVFRAFYMEAWDRPVLEQMAGKNIMGLGPDAHVRTGVAGQLCGPNQEGLDQSHLKIWINPKTQPLSERYMDIPPNTAAPAPTPTPTPTPTPPPTPVDSWQSYKSGKTTLYKILEGDVVRINGLSLTECRWLCTNRLKIKAP